MRYKKIMILLVAFLMLAFTASASAAAYKDVSRSHWAYENIMWASDNGLMNGTSSTAFSPEESMTRGMLVTVLYRMDGSPKESASVPFTDLKENWYKNAVRWAYKNNIVNGTGPKSFEPDSMVTRAQAAAILYRYSQYKG